MYCLQICASLQHNKIAKLCRAPAKERKSAERYVPHNTLVYNPTSQHPTWRVTPTGGMVLTVMTLLDEPRVICITFLVNAGVTQ